MNAGEYQLSLHPSQYSRAVDRILVQVRRPLAERLHFSYVVEGRCDEILLPPLGASARRDNLWKTTCFEAFLQPAGTASYVELNFSPSGDWAAYDFEAYRAGMAQAFLPAPPQIRLTRTPERIALEAIVSLDLQPVPYRLGLTAVIEEVGGTLSHWALDQHGSTPDFHRADCFRGELPPPTRP